jgi:membrane-associated phospholipid phosphatase
LVALLQIGHPTEHHLHALVAKLRAPDRRLFGRMPYARSRPVVSALVAALLASLSPSTTRADTAPDSHRLKWDDRWPKFRPVEYLATGVVGGAAVAMYFYLPPQLQPHWVGGILFDNTVRNAIRVRSAPALQTAWALSDAVDVTLVALVFGLDSLAVPAIRGSPDVSIQLGLMDGEAYGFSSVLTIGLYDSVGRARPSYEDCQRDPAFVGCNISPTASFPSGHTNEAFTAAGASCANHRFVPIYGSRFWDGLACVRDVVLATADGVLRIIGDRHYATDVLAGGAIGFAFGYGMPTLLHYRAANIGIANLMISPMTGQKLGMVVVGAF